MSTPSDGLRSGLYRKLLFPLLTLPDAEASHNAGLRALAAAGAFAPLLRTAFAVDDPRLKVSALGLTFPNPVGLCAGFDKNGVAVRGIAALGFGHVEVGTVTPRPQPGKPKPRLFRLKQDHALINRLGFPSQGAEVVVANLRHLVRRDFVLGANVGPNADSVGVDDFVAAAFPLAPHADYMTVNVSSPNTTGLRGMQQADVLASLLDGLGWLQQPLLVKIAPDLTDDDLRNLLDVIVAHDVAGIIATNTTLERPPALRSRRATEAGGLSGEPLRQRSTEVVRAIFRYTEGKLPIIGSGGVATPEHALEKIEAGASLVQIYTGFIYEGPLAVRNINQGLLRTLHDRGLDSVQSLVGSKS
jgi:dihydroorotate dehydrogenase